MGRGRIGCAGEVMLELAPAGAATYRQDFAGDTYNTAVYLARLGCPVSYLTCLGDDGFSSALLARMRGEGIDTGQVRRLPGRQPGLYLISNDADGERRFSYWRSDSPARELFDRPLAVAGLALFYFSGITLAVARGGLDNLLATLRNLHEQGVPVAFDPNYRPGLWDDRAQAQAHYREVLPHCGTVLATQEDDARLWGMDDPAASLEFYTGFGAGEVVIKGADLVAYARCGGERCERRAATVDALDTTGAGDAFNAGFLAARQQGADLAEAIRRAQALAATVVQYRGAIIPRDQFDT